MSKVLVDRAAIKTLLKSKKQFKIKFRQYDNAHHTFIPAYSLESAKFEQDDIIAWQDSLGGQIYIGLVTEVYGKQIRVNTYFSHVSSVNFFDWVEKCDILCKFIPE